ncbi:MAG TPA: MaoC family dehydratase N-terminal domain-containing protein [Burkholderiales bacterium]|nr:MaoC family dehydratase N-terminal domain-containing protein [Burkholderiales bacterium]
MNEELEQYRRWIGRRETEDDVITPWPVRAMTATLDRNDPLPAPGEPIPLGWHWFYFLEAAPASVLAADGHPRRGGFMPPVQLPRRMWAGGRIEFRRALRMGEAARRESEIVAVTPKSGRSGDMVFVTVRHTILGSGEITAVEETDIVYRDAARSGAASAPRPAPAQAAWCRTLAPDAALLFRYSALIFNAHRIHYDHRYVTHEEGYPGLIVHGPLQATLLLDLCRRHSPRPLAQFDYRASGPLFDTEDFSVNGNPAADGASAELWTASASGSLAMSATARFA